MSNITIKTKIALLSLLISLMSVLTVSILFYCIYSQYIIKSTIESNQQSTEYLTDYLSNYFHEIELTAVELYNEPNDLSLGPSISIMDIIRNGYSTNAYDYHNERQILNDYFIFIQNQRKSIVKTIVFTQNENIVDIYNRNNLYTKINLDSVTKRFIEQNKDESVFLSYYDPEINKDLLVYKKIIYDLFTHDKIGTLIYFINYDEFPWEKYSLQDNQLMVLNSYNEFIYHSDPTYLSTKIKDDLMAAYNNRNSHTFYDGKLMHYIDLPHTPLKLINIAPLEELHKSKNIAIFITLIIIIGIFIFNSILSILYAKKITHPIQILCNTMKQVEKGDFNVKLMNTTGKDEISVLNHNFNYMTSKIKEMIRFQYQLEIKNREAQLMLLQAQINPHFLYNTLQTISGKAILNGDYETSTMCKALSDVFRYSIENDEKETSIQNELLHIHNYLFIQRIRFNDSIDVHFNIEQGLNHCLIPRIILQPIVENAIMHGIEKVDMDKVIIKISVQKQDGTIQIIIEDNGPGIEEKKLRSILRHIDRQPMEVSSGLTKRPSIGLRNVNCRIKILYGDAYGMTICNLPTRGVKVVVTVPYKKEDDHVSSNAC